MWNQWSELSQISFFLKNEMIQIRRVFSVILYMKKFDYDFQILTESFLIDVVLALWSFYFEFFLMLVYFLLGS